MSTQQGAAGGNCHHVTPLVLANTSACGNRGGGGGVACQSPGEAARLAQRRQKVPLLALLARKCSFFFMALSIFNDINALKRLGCQPLEAQWDVQPSDASQAAEAEHGADAIDLEKCDI